MEKADFIEVYTALVDCPYCGVIIKLYNSSLPYVKGEVVTCNNCGEVFELRDSI